VTEREIFLAAVEKDDPTERATYLDQACGADATLRQRVEALLRAHERAANFMDVPVVEQLAGDCGGLDFLAPSQKPGSLGCLAHYEALEVVGRGGMGVVFRAFDTKLHRVVAIKALAPQLATSSPARQRFVREARAAAAVTHEHVIDIHAVDDAGPVPYLVMQYIDGTTLQKKLDRTGQLSLKEILRIGMQIAEGLAAAHRQGLVHRDVKPANILLENGVERVKLSDFGLARAGDDASLTQSGVVAGTPMYMSPEQADGLPVDFRSDLFSLGSVLYAMCTGRPPFRAPSPLAVLKRVCEETPRPIQEINPELPPSLGNLVARLHAKAPADRFASAREVADLLARHLAELQQGGTPSAPRQPQSANLPAEKPALAPRGRPRLWLMATAVLLALLAGLGLSEATGITNIRGTVIRLFAPEGTPAPAQVVAADDAAWERTVAALPAEEQVKAVAARLKDLNPGFDGKVTHTITGDAVTELRFSTDQVTNIAPVRVLTKLTVLDVAGKPGKLADLAPLKGMPLSRLTCNNTTVSDLSPLKGMPLTWLDCDDTAVSNLTPLKDMPLRGLRCQCPQVSDLSPLQGMLLDTLVAGSGVTDLSPLQGMPLRHLHLYGATQLKKLSPLKGIPLEYLNVGHTAVTDLSPLKDLTTLRRLHLEGLPVTDLSMLKGPPLEYLDISSTRVSDLSMLKGLPLEHLDIRSTRVSDLAPLKGLPLKQLGLDFRAERDAEVLRSLTGLEQINEMPAAEFWKAHAK
jgi:serine/threonine protein kinase